MATLCLINFPEFSESKEFLEIERSEVCVLGGGAKGRTIKLSISVYIYLGDNWSCDVSVLISRYLKR